MKVIDQVQDPMTALDQLPNKMEKSIARLREFEPPEGYYLAFSGGKDSQCIYRLAEMAGIKFNAHYSVTCIDPPDLVRFIRRQYPDVIHEFPRKSFWSLIATKGLPTRKGRWCCEKLKENGGNGQRVLTGIRKQESNSRANRGIVEHCRVNGSNKLIINPILEWTETDVWRFIRDQKLPYCSLYDEGMKRLGCMFCPFSSDKEKAFFIEKYPKYKGLFITAIERISEDKPMRKHKTAEEIWFWYLSHDDKLIPDIESGLFT